MPVSGVPIFYVLEHPMLTQQPYYTPSGKFSVGGLITMTVFGTLAAAALSVAYGYLTTYNPFIYFNILATFGFGFVMGLAASMGATMGKIRNSAIASLIAVLVGLMGVYFSWVIWLYASSGQADEAMLVLDPIALFAILDHLAQQGVWSLKSWTPRGETLYGIWGLEALFIVGATVYSVYKGVTSTPFCEDCNAWCDEELEEKPAGFVTDAKAFRHALELGNLTVLGELDKSNYAQFSRSTLYVCPKGTHAGYLSVTNVQESVNKKGDTEEKKSSLVEHLTVSDQTNLQSIRDILSVNPFVQAEPTPEAS